MGHYEDYVLISDLDGTLLNRERKVSQENKAALKRFTEGGGHFCVATGRTPANTVKFLQGIDINTACVFFNGAMLYDYKRHEAIREISLGGQEVRRAAACLAQKFPELFMQVFTSETAYVVSDESLNGLYVPRITYDYTFSDLAAIQDKKWLKIMLAGGPEALQEAAEKMKAMKLDEMFNAFFAASDCYELVNKDASKGHMLQFLRELPENCGRRIIAQGDYGNDTYMLQMADVGVASGNAHAETKAAADIVGVDCNEHLAAYVIGLIDSGRI